MGFDIAPNVLTNSYFPDDLETTTGYKKYSRLALQTQTGLFHTKEPLDIHQVLE
jgi:hypothetical protein